MSEISEWSPIDEKNVAIDGYALSNPYQHITRKLMGAIKRKLDGVDAKLDSVEGAYVFKGVKDTVAALPSSGNEVGDTWSVTEMGGQNYAWDGTGWDALGPDESAGPFVSQSKDIHVDASAGDDANDGKTASTAVRSLDRAFRLWNARQTPQPNIYLHGNHVYETPAVAADASEGMAEGMLLYTGGAPHFYGVEDTPGDGSPTLKFIFCVTGTTPETVVRTSKYYTYGYNAQTSGPRFYTSHLNFSNIAIDSNVNGVYFEGCSLTISNVDFKIPCRAVSCAGGFSNCSFYGAVITHEDTDYNPFGSSVSAALYLYNSLCSIASPTFNVEDGKTFGCGVYNRSSVRIDGTVTIKPQTASGGSNCVVGIDSSVVHVSTGTISGTATNWARGISSGGCSQLQFNNATMFAAWHAIGSGVVDSGNGIVKKGGSLIGGADCIVTQDLSAVLSIHCGDTAAGGGGVWLYGKDHTNAGKAILQASNGTVYKSLSANSSGSLTWDGQTVQTTSDERLKTPLAAVPDEVLDAWEAVQWGQYQYLDAVAEKGPSARLHLGLIAQRVKAVFEERGLDACRYGILCHEVQPESEAGPGTELWMVRYTEALAMEVACQRRLVGRLESRIADLEEARADGNG